MGKVKVILIAIIAVAAIGAGAVYFLDINLFGSKSAKGKSVEELAELSIDTDVVTTNLASAGNFAVVQFNILLNNKEAKEELSKRAPEVRDAIIYTAASFTKDQLLGTDGIDKLINELSKRLNHIVQTGKVERVLITELKLQ